MKSERLPTVTVIHDNPAQLTQVSTLLEKEGLAVLAYQHPVRALQNMRLSGPPDLVIVGVDMVETDGWALCKLLRSSEYSLFREVPILAISDSSVQEDVERLVAEAEVNAFLNGPYAPQALRDCVHELLHKRVAAKRPRVLRESQNRLRAVLDAVPEIVLVYDGDGVVRYVNTTGAQQLEWHRDELVGQRMSACLAPEVFDGGAEALRAPGAVSRVQKATPTRAQGFRAPNGSLLYERTFVSRSGRPIEAEVNERAFEFDGAPCTLCVARDISERKRDEKIRAELQTQLRQSQKLQALGTLAGGIAHDLSNILSPILGFTDIAYKNLPDNSPARAQLLEVLKAGVRAKQLVHQIMAFSRQVEQCPRPVEIRLIVKEALALLRAVLPATIEIEQHVAAECGTVLADATRVHQVIMNLCTNAYHAMRDTGGTLTVSLDVVELDEEHVRLLQGIHEGVYVRLSVRDTGHGMDAATRERIFEPFFTTKTHGEGLGMGLATVYGIVSEAGGTIRVESTPGQGSTFDIYLPRHHTAAPEEIFFSEPSPGGRETVMVVDDEEPIVRMIQESLEQLGYTVAGFTSSLEALNAFHMNPDEYDVAIADQIMPKLTGAELAKEFLTVRPDFPIVMITGFSDLFKCEDAQRIGIRDYVVKPVFPQDLARIVRRALDVPPTELN